MSKNPLLPSLEAQQAPTTDMTPVDLKRIEQFEANGKMGLATVTTVEMERMMQLYLGGKTYTQISQIMRCQKDTVLYLAKKFNWYAMRMEYLADLEKNLSKRMIEAKLSSKNFLLELISVWEKKIGRKLEGYLRSDNEAIASEIDLKEVDKYLKTVEMLHKISGDVRTIQEKAPMIGLHLGEGVTVQRDGDKIDISPKESAIKSKLKEWADFRRMEDEKTAKSKSDIEINRNKKPDGDEVNEDE